MGVENTENREKLDFSDIADGRLKIALAKNDDEILQAQRLRYQVFYEEMQAKACAEKREKQIDFDDYDVMSDHLLIIDSEKQAQGNQDYVVGCYRLLPQDRLTGAQKFYTEGEYDISKLRASNMNLLELGRSCVAEPYRSRIVLDLLWRGLTRYIFHYDIDVLFGCASFPGTDATQYQLPLSFLYHNHLAPEFLCPKVLTGMGFDMSAPMPEEISPRLLMRQIPPLIKGYLQVGSMVGDGAFIDKEFNTVDVCIVFIREQANERYYKHYGRYIKND